MTKDRSPSHRGRVLLAAAALVAGSLFAVSGSAQAAPLAPAPAEALAGDSGVTAVRHGWGHHHGWGHRHHGWGHRHHGWGRGHHWGWGHHRHHHHGWGHRGWRHRW